VQQTSTADEIVKLKALLDGYNTGRI